MFTTINPIEIITASSVSLLANAAANAVAETSTVQQRCDIYCAVVDKAQSMGLISEEDAYELRASSDRWFWANQK